VPQPTRYADAPVEASAPEGSSDNAAGRAKSRKRRGGERRTRAQGRYLMCVHTTKEATHIATLEGRTMVEYTVAKAADETNQIDGNIYVGRIQNVLPGMELAFIDIGIPKNAVLYRGDISFDNEDVEGVDQNGNTFEFDANGNQIQIDPSQIPNWVSYSIPGSQYWPVVAFESGLLLLGSLVLAAVAFVWVDRRRPY